MSAGMLPNKLDLEMNSERQKKSRVLWKSNDDE